MTNWDTHQWCDTTCSLTKHGDTSSQLVCAEVMPRRAGAALDVVARDAVLNDLGGPALVGGEARQPARHRLDDGQPERFVQRRLHKRAPRVCAARAGVSSAPRGSAAGVLSPVQLHPAHA